MQSHKSDTLLGDSSNPFENVDNKAIENSSPALSSRRSGSEEHNQQFISIAINLRYECTALLYL